MNRLALALVLALALLGVIAALPRQSDASTSTATESGEITPPTVPGIAPVPSGGSAEQAQSPSSMPPASAPSTSIPTPETPSVASQAQQAPAKPATRESQHTHAAAPPVMPSSVGANNALPTNTPSPPAPSPSAVFGASLALTSESQLMNLFLNTYRTPPFLLPIYLAAGRRYGVPWQVLAAINEVESDYGHDLSVSSAGAEGWMQFMPTEWLGFGVDANGAGVRDPYNPADAIFAAARYLAAAEAAHDLRGAIYSYNHSSSYVESVILRSRLISSTPQSMIGGLTAIVTGRFPVEGGGVHTATAVWSRSTQPVHTTSAAHSARGRPQAPAPTPELAAAASAATPGSAVSAVSISARPGAPVVAVQSAEVTRTGRDRRLGRFIELRDAYGDVYTYAELGQVAKRYPRLERPSRHATARGARAIRAARTLQAPLRRGARVSSGTVLGGVPGGAPNAEVHFLFEIRPAGAGPIDPRPVLQAWRLLADAVGHPEDGTQPLFGPDSAEAPIAEIQLLSTGRLQTRLLSDPGLRLDQCGRQDIAAGRIDRRVLAALDFLLVSGLDPTVSALECGLGGDATATSRSEHARGDAVTISALNGVSIRGHDAPNSLVELAAHRLLALPGALRPAQIVGPVHIGASAETHAGTQVLAGAPDRLDVGFAQPKAADATAPSAGQKPTSQGSRAAAPARSAPAVRARVLRHEPELDTAQWRRLIARISRLTEPHVPVAPTSAAVGDNEASPPPSAGPAPALTPLATSGATPLSTPAPPGPAAQPGPRAASQPGVDAPALDLRAAPSTPMTSEPQVLLEEETTGGGPAGVLNGFVTLNARAANLASIASFVFQYAPAEAEKPTWTPIATTTNPPTSAASASLDAEALPDGLYDMRVIATTPSGAEYQAELPDRLIANNSPVVTLANPSTNLRGKVTLRAEVPKTPGLAPLTSVSFQWARADGPTGSGRWHTIETRDATHKTLVTTTFDTTSILSGDGNYDFRVVPADEAGEAYASIPVRKRLIDNTPPAVSQVSVSGSDSPLSGLVTLAATAEDPGSGVASVRFEARSAVGVSAWKNIGEVTLHSQQSNSYSHVLNTQSLPNGLYDFRVIANDVAGNEGLSPLLTGVEVRNQLLTSPIAASIAGVVAPAEHITFLGAIAGSPQHEAWAYGFTSAPPAEADGSLLPYEAQGEQLVLLRYTDDGGWQIADVLREPDGHSAFKLLPASKVAGMSGGKHEAGQVHVAGAMAPSGEAWIWVAEASTEAGAAPMVGLFHRAPGGPFALDERATHNLAPLLGSTSTDLVNMNVSVRLGESGGQVYGMLVSPQQPAAPPKTPAPGGLEHAKLQYGLLQAGEWSLETATPPPIPFKPSDDVTLELGDVQGPGSGWGAFEVNALQPGQGLILGHFERGQWTFPRTEPGALGTGLDALDLTGPVANPNGWVKPTGLKADGNAVWIEADVKLPPHQAAPVVARYDGSTGKLTDSWCTLPVANSCGKPLDPDHPAAVPDAIFETDGGPVALALRENFVDVFAHGEWSSVATPGYGNPHSEPPLPAKPGEDVFSSPNEGWIAGPHASALGHWSAAGGQSSPLASWPLPDRSPLTSVALPPDSQGSIDESGALAVGFDGTTLSYGAGAGWLDQPAPPRARHINLLGVAFAGPSSAFAVGQFGVILRWNGTAWSEDPQSISLTQSQLNAVAFGSSGEGWAVGGNGTILHYDGHSWSIESPPAADSGADITSVAVAGSSVFAVAAGNLITRAPHGGWESVGTSLLPTPEPRHGSLTLVAGLPDGGVIAAGNSVVLVREASEGRFDYAAQPLQGLAVALAPFREADGKLRTYVSVAPSGDVGSPIGDGELMRETGGGWQDLSRAQYSGSAIEGDGAVKSDPVLAVAAGTTGEHAWAAGGYDGTKDAAEQGTKEAQANRPVGWQTASIWRYDVTGSAHAPGLTTQTPSLPAKPGTVSFAFFTSPMCRETCSNALNAQPDVNLTSAATQIATYAAQPGGPAFAMLGGNAVGPVEGRAFQAGDGRLDFAHLPELLAPLGTVPTFAAFGRFDYVRGERDETRPWAEAFANAPPPFGSGPGAPGITPLASGASTHEVHRYYAFDATQNGGSLRVIVLDNSKGSLEASAEGQTAWLEGQLADARKANRSVVAITALPLRATDTSDGEAVAAKLAGAGVVAVFTTNGTVVAGEKASEARELDEHFFIPQHHEPGAPQIPEYEGASLGYQQPQNNGVMWYSVSVDTSTREAHVAAIPVIDSLSLKAVDGLSVARSLTLKFEAVGRRPAGTLATKVGEAEPFPGYDNYVEIPAPGCGGRPCVEPSYSFTSSDPTIGNFVIPSGAGSPLPKLDAGGHPIASSTSGLFCAYNSGSTTVTITAGLLTYSLPVTVQPGGFGAPCGTVFRAGVGTVVHVHSAQTQRAPGGAGTPPPPVPATLSGVSPSLAFILSPPAIQPSPAVPASPKATPAPPRPPPAPLEPAPFPQVEQVGAAPAIVPPATPPVEPIPPGGTAQAPSAAERREKARKHASQSAFTIRPAGVSGQGWFYGAVGVTALLALLLSARALPARPRPRPAFLVRAAEADRRRRRR